MTKHPLGIDYLSYQASGVPKVSLKLTAWEIWQQASRHVDAAQQQVSTQVDGASVQSSYPIR